MLVAATAAARPSDPLSPRSSSSASPRTAGARRQRPARRSVVTCAANDFGYDHVFERQIEALGNEGDVFVSMTPSATAKPHPRQPAGEVKGLTTVAFLGKTAASQGDVRPRAARAVET